MPEVTLKYRIKILNLLYEELRLINDDVEYNEIKNLIYENLVKLDEEFKIFRGE